VTGALSYGTLCSGVEGVTPLVLVQERSPIFRPVRPRRVDSGSYAAELRELSRPSYGVGPEASCVQERLLQPPRTGGER
jgi:hypothetical protein